MPGSSPATPEGNCQRCKPHRRDTRNPVPVDGPVKKRVDSGAGQYGNTYHHRRPGQRYRPTSRTDLLRSFPGNSPSFGLFSHLSSTPFHIPAWITVSTPASSTFGRLGAADGTGIQTTDDEGRSSVVMILLGYLGDRSKIVKALSMQALANLAKEEPVSFLLTG